jgi:hypothetical protein
MKVSTIVTLILLLVLINSRRIHHNGLIDSLRNWASGKFSGFKEPSPELVSRLVEKG